MKTIEDVARGFEEFKAANAAELAEIKKSGAVDPLTAEKIERMSKAFGEFEAKKDILAALEAKKDQFDSLEQEVIALKAAGLGGKGDERVSPEVAEHRKAYADFLRKGREDGLDTLEQKALNVTTSADGGFAVPEQLDRNILSLIKQVTPFRAVAGQVTIGGAEYKKLVNLRGTASGWVGETATRPETSSPQFAEITPNMGEVYANPFATQRMLDDAFFDVEQFLVEEIGAEFAKAEGAAFISGSGTNRPLGFLAGTINVSSDAARTFGHLQMVKTGVAGAFVGVTSSTSPVDTFIDTVHSLKSELRAGAVWMANSLTMAAIRKFKNVDGDLIWRPGLAEGQPQTILGYAAVEAQDMPDVATNTFPIAFGNFGRGYLIVDRFGTRILRDPYSNKPYVQFYATKRVGGSVIDSEAIKVIATRT
jgi:HK97 family phage major capsid protein